MTSPFEFKGKTTRRLRARTRVSGREELSYDQGWLRSDVRRQVSTRMPPNLRLDRDGRRSERIFVPRR